MVTSVSEKCSAHGQKRAKGVVAAGAGMEGVEEQLRLAVEPGRDRGMARRDPLAGRFQQRFRPA